MRTLSIALALVGLVGVAGCKGGKAQKFSEEELANNPAANFVRGVETLRNPDRKTGAVDHLAALGFFEKSAALGGGAKASFNAGWVAENMGDISTAEAHYRTAYDTDSSYDASLYSLTRVLAEQGKHADAVQVYKLHADSHPDDYEIRNDYISALVAAGQFDAAIAEAQEILRHDPKNAGVYRNLSSLYYAKGQYGMSQLTAEKALQLNDGDPGVYNNMGVTHLIQGDEPAAIAKFKTALKLDPASFETNMNLGYVALNSGDYQLASTSFDAALKTNPSSLEGKMGMAIAQRGLGDYKSAESLYDDIIDADPLNRAAYFNAATLHEKYTKEFAKALKYLQAYRDSQAGNISPTDNVFARMEMVERAKAAEDERKRIEAEKKRAEEERRKRNAELLTSMSATITATQAKLAANASCLDPMLVEEVGMVLEQAAMVVEAEEVDMAPDIQQLLDGYLPMVDSAVEECAAGGGAAPPADAPPEGEEVPQDGEPVEGEADAPVEGEADSAPAGDEAAAGDEAGVEAAAGEDASPAGDDAPDAAPPE
ncbi:MAG: tetratricopeptide (TPR) repeat protein [Myxococcota bacterium]|jgi:tetratricopeptide (TPR) repeat protein